MVVLYLNNKMDIEATLKAARASEDNWNRAIERYRVREAAAKAAKNEKKQKPIRPLKHNLKALAADIAS